jgi:hypothetical protein
MELSGAPGIRKKADSVAVAKLTAGGAAVAITVPTDIGRDKPRYAFFSKTDDFWCNVDVTAVVPAATSQANSTNPVFNPQALHIEGSTTISLISEFDCSVVVEFFR